MVDKFLSPCTVHIIDSNIIRARMNVYETQIRKYGGQFLRKVTSDDRITHLLVDDDLPEEKVAKIIATRFPKLLEDGEGETKLLRTKWLSACLKHKKLVDPAPYVVHLPKPEEKTEVDQAKASTSQENKSRKRPSSAQSNKGVYDQTTDDGSGSEESSIHSARSSHSRSCESSPSPSSPKRLRSDGEHGGSDTDDRQVNHNKLITDKLKILAEGYKSMNDKWRALSYEKAIRALSHCPKPISSYQEVRNMRGIGQRLADKIWEIHESGELRKADEFLRDDKVQTMNLFTNIHGVGPTIAEHWYQQGFRTLKDLEEKANLTWQQRIGLKYYDDIQQRMDRAEAAGIVDTVIQAVKKLDPDLIITAGGSFRRGCKTCGDVDFILTHPDGRSHAGALRPLVKMLTESGFLTDHLVDVGEGWDQKMYLGLCKLPGDNYKWHRRLDIIAVPYSEHATALIYFTGNVYFTRSIYSKAKHMGMRLNQHGLRGGVMRQGGETLNEGYPIPTPTEESVFEKLGIPYRRPEERDFINFKEDL